MAETEQEKFQRQIDEAAHLIEEIEAAGKTVPGPVKAIIKAMQEGVEVGMSAHEAADHLAKFYKDMQESCEKLFPIDSNEYIKCDVDSWRKYNGGGYAGRVNAVLNPDNPQSVVSIYWQRKSRGWACLWREVKNGTPSGLYRKCFVDPDSPYYIPPAHSLPKSAPSPSPSSTPVSLTPK